MIKFWSGSDTSVAYKADSPPAPTEPVSALQFWAIVLLWSGLMIGIGFFIGWRQGVYAEHERIQNTPPAASNWWKQIQGNH